MERKERMAIENNLYKIGLCLPCIGGALALLWNVLPVGITSKLYTPCLFHAATGLYCPGCGGSRAVATLLEGDVLSSFFYHPIVLYGAVLYVWFLFSHTLQRLLRGKRNIGMRYRNLYLYLALAIVILNAVVKNAALLVCQVDLLHWLDRV